MLGGFGHNALHLRGRRWDCWLFECAGVSHAEWRFKHMAHHAATNREGDPEADSFEPLVYFTPPRAARPRCVERCSGWCRGLLAIVMLRA